MKIFKPKNFHLFELVDSITYKRFGQRAWRFLDVHALITLQLLRDRYGKTTVNDWKWGGKRKYSGFRPFYCPVGAEYSMHRLAKAYDPIFKNVTAEEVRRDIRKFSRTTKQLPTGIPIILEFIGGIEKKVSWFHFDTRPTLNGNISFFNK